MSTRSRCGSTTVPTFVFDEVDAGVGGAAAIEIGRRLAALAERTQVIVVTHLAQVAAFANNHLNVVKDASGAVTSAGPPALAQLAQPPAADDDREQQPGHQQQGHR